MLLERYVTNNPQLEGSRDNILFSGTVLPPKPYINLHIEQNKK